MHVMILIEEHLDGIKEESIMFVVKKEQNVLEAFKWTGDVNQTEDPVWIVDLFKKQRAAIIRKNGDILLRIFTMNKGLVDVGQGCYVVYDGESYKCYEPNEFKRLFDIVEEVVFK